MCDELPQWIMSSEIGAYHPRSETIFIKKQSFKEMLITFGHEIMHWFIHKFVDDNMELQKLWDFGKEPS